MTATRTAHTPLPLPGEIEGDIDSLKALTEVFLTFMDILIEESYGFSTPSFFDFKGALATISEVADTVLSKVCIYMCICIFF